MAQTNGTAQEMPTLTALMAEMDAFKIDSERTPTTCRLHPVDFDAVRRLCTPAMDDGLLRHPPTVYGVRIVLDYSAPRLT